MLLLYRHQLSEIVCVYSCPPQKKKKFRESLCAAVDNCVLGHVTFPGMCGKLPDWSIDRFQCNVCELLNSLALGFISCTNKYLES